MERRAVDLRRATQFGVSLAAIVLMGPALGQEDAKKLFDVRGRVVDVTTNAPLEGVRIAVGKFAGTTDARSEFTVGDVPQGVYPVRPTLDGYAVAAYRDTRLAVHLSADRPTPPLVLKMTKASALGGTVEDEDHNPIPGIRVYCLERIFFAGDPLMRPYQEETTDDEGEFSFEVPLGEYHLYATPEASAEAGQERFRSVELQRLSALSIPIHRMPKGPFP